MAADGLKGEPISSFIGGTYGGLEGWLDVSKEKSPISTYVIVDMGMGQLKYTRVKDENYVCVLKSP